MDLYLLIFPPTECWGSSLWVHFSIEKYLIAIRRVLNYFILPRNLRFVIKIVIFIPWSEHCNKIFNRNLLSKTRKQFYIICPTRLYFSSRCAFLLRDGNKSLKVLPEHRSLKCVLNYPRQLTCNIAQIVLVLFLFQFLNVI